MENVKINWDAMHKKNYDGSCKFCGGQCESAESIKNWELAEEELVKIENVNYWQEDDELQKKHVQLSKQISEKLTYVLNDKKETPQQKWNANNIKQYKIDVMKNTESDIIEHLDKQGNKAGYIKNLIREDIKKLSN